MGQGPCCARGAEVNAQQISAAAAAREPTPEVEASHSASSSPVRRQLPGNKTYQGGWSDGEAHGAGVLKMADGARYTGQFTRGKKHGHGIYVYASGATYTGQWIGDSQEGEGQERWSDGYSFEGQFLRGAKHGQGHIFWANGCSYQGEFTGNEMQGDGTYRWHDGRGYSGQWVRNSMGPHGSMWWPDKRSYRGSFQDGKRHGEGRLQWPDGATYTGQWFRGKQQGEAWWQTANGCQRRCRWKEGRFLEWLGPNPVMHAESRSEDSSWTVCGSRRPAPQAEALEVAQVQSLAWTSSAEETPLPHTAAIVDNASVEERGAAPENLGDAATTTTATESQGSTQLQETETPPQAQLALATRDATSPHRSCDSCCLPFASWYRRTCAWKLATRPREPELPKNVAGAESLLKEQQQQPPPQEGDVHDDFSQNYAQEVMICV